MDERAPKFFVEGIDDAGTHRRRLELVRSIESDAGHDRAVIEAMAWVPRHAFVPREWHRRAYDDMPLTIGYGQTISQPAVVAMMTHALRPQAHQTVLEVGTGSGYQAAVLARLVERVDSVEVVPELAERAAATLHRLRIDNVHVHVGDAFEGLGSNATFDGIIVTAAPDHVPEVLLRMLRSGGRMVIPVGPTLGIQELTVLERRGESIERHTIAPVRFVPMVRSQPRHTD